MTTKTNKTNTFAATIMNAFANTLDLWSEAESGADRFSKRENKGRDQPL